MNETRRLLCCGLVCGVLRLIGIIERNIGNEFIFEYLYPFQRDAFVQLGGAVLSIAVFFALLRFVSRRRAEQIYLVVKSFAPKVILFLAVFFVAGELVLRVLYWDGISINHGDYGAMSRRFGRDFQYNRFDKSRGPDVAGKKDADSVRVLVQEDSITWGQGIKHEYDMCAACANYRSVTL
jgi:hypothetical protein